MSKKSAEEGFHEVGRTTIDSVTHFDHGLVEVEQVAGVNEEPRVRSAGMSKRGGRVVVKMMAKEDNSVVKEGSTAKFASMQVKQVTEIETVKKSPISKPASNERIIKAWKKLKTLATLNGILSFFEKVIKLIAQTKTHT
jgi:hypothetical protein